MTAKVLDNRYKLIKVLGKGGFGRTYLARDMRRPGSPLCVVKQLKPASTDPDFIREARRLFNTEAETLERLGNHDQIPQLLAYFEEQDFFLVQEYIEGIPLNKELELVTDENTDLPSLDPDHAPPKSKGKQLGETAVIGILRDILNVLEFVHSENVIHRDIKPENLIRRAKDGKLVLIDFGAVRAMEDQNARLENVEGESRFTVTIGTPGYMSNEQCAGRPNYTSDIYATGMVAIKALTGLNPQELDTDPETGEMQWRKQVKVSNGLAIVLTRMIRYRFSDRYQSVKEVQQALSAFLIPPETKPVHQPRSANAAARSTYRKANQMQSNAGAGLLIIGLLCVVGAIGFLLLNKPQKPTLVIQNPTVPPVDSDVPTQPALKPKLSALPTVLSQSISLVDNKETQLQGSVNKDQSVSYTFTAKANQPFTIVMTGERVGLEVLAPNGAVLSSGTTSWQNPLPSDGLYTINIKQASGLQPTTFAIRLTLAPPPADVQRIIEVR